VVLYLAVLCHNPEFVRAGPTRFVENPFAFRIPFRKVIGGTAWIPWTCDTVRDLKWLTARRGNNPDTSFADEGEFFTVWRPAHFGFGIGP